MNNYGDEMKNKKSYFTVPLGKKDIKDIKKINGLVVIFLLTKEGKKFFVHLNRLMKIARGKK